MAILLNSLKSSLLTSISIFFLPDIWEYCYLSYFNYIFTLWFFRPESGRVWASDNRSLGKTFSPFLTRHNTWKCVYSCNSASQSKLLFTSSHPEGIILQGFYLFYVKSQKFSNSLPSHPSPISRWGSLPSSMLLWKGKRP